MFNVIEYKGAEYRTQNKRIVSSEKYTIWRDDYIRFEWDNGFLDMRKYDWDKLPKRKKKLIYDLMKGR